MSKRFKIGIVVLGLALLPMGCMVGPKYSRPEEQKADRYQNTEIPIDTAKSVVNLKWFDVFDDDVLEGLINKGIENNYDLKIALARLERARAELGYSKADLLPSFYYSGTVNANKDAFIPSNVGANMNWELDFWGKVRHENKALNAELLATDEARKVILTGIISNIAISYFQLRDLDNQLDITKKTLIARQESFNIINERFMKGYTSEVDKVQIEQQVAIAEAGIPRIERQITFLENVISVLIGQVPGRIERGKANYDQRILVDIPLSLPSKLLENRPDIREAELRYMAANERIGVAQAMRYPSFNIAAMAGFANSELSDLFLSSSYLQNASAGVVGPIFNFGKNKRRVEIFRQEAEQSKFFYQKIYLIAVSEVEQSLKDVKTYKEEWQARNKQVMAARKNLELSNARYYNGYVSYLEVLDVQRNLYEAELELSRLTQQQLSATVDLYRALGGGWN
ncbi:MULTISPECIES: efflux transporter outer membrane subunit [Flavobacterium]|uniref:efflux transporter outer membrane subunit n=1 Tax=Flavobacterium TaxID=237 RepID=UPI001FCC59EE|nr:MULTISPECIES: efflux transporter outer membrane subunit [Flavobacterium]UOK43210.1 efflux transporter outer membrane subunit [Flavobacterium enshiense]